MTARRSLLKKLVRGTLAAGLLPFATLLAFPAWARPARAFAQRQAKEAIDALFPGAALEASERVQLQVPEVAENGAVVPVTVKVDAADVEAVAVVATENPRSLIGYFQFTRFSAPPVSLRIKLAKTQDLIAIAKVGNRILYSKRPVRVTVGGCAE